MKKVGLGLILVSLAGCGSDKGPLKFSTPQKVINTLETENKKDPIIENDKAYVQIKTFLFDTSCIKCHNPETALKKNRLDLTSRENILENFDDIIYRMTDAFDMGFDYMPPKGDPVSPALIQELKTWKADIHFANLQKNLFETSCLKCHGPTQTRHIDLTSKEVILKNFDDIVYRMTTAFEDNLKKPMPPKGKGEPVSPKLIEELKNWKNLAD